MTFKKNRKDPLAKSTPNPLAKSRLGEKRFVQTFTANGNLARN